MADGLNMSRRIRRTPYTERVESAGVRGQDANGEFGIRAGDGGDASGSVNM